MTTRPQRYRLTCELEIENPRLYETVRAHLYGKLRELDSKMFFLPKYDSRVAVDFITLEKVDDSTKD